MDNNKTFVVVGAHGNMPPVLTGEEAASVCDTMISTSLSARSELEKELAVIKSRLAKMDQTLDQELLQTLDSVQDEKVRLELFLKDMKRRSDGYLYWWPEIESVSVDSNDGVTVFTIHYIEYTVEENAEPFSKTSGLAINKYNMSSMTRAAAKAFVTLKSNHWRGSKAVAATFSERWLRMGLPRRTLEIESSEGRQGVIAS